MGGFSMKMSDTREEYEFNADFFQVSGIKELLALLEEKKILPEAWKNWRKFDDCDFYNINKIDFEDMLVDVYLEIDVSTDSISYDGPCGAQTYYPGTTSVDVNDYEVKIVGFKFADSDKITLNEKIDISKFVGNDKFETYLENFGDEILENYDYD